MPKIQLLARLTVYPCDIFYWHSQNEFVLELVLPDKRKAIQTFSDTETAEADKAWKRLTKTAYKAHHPRWLVRTYMMRLASRGKQEGYRTALFEQFNFGRAHEINPTNNSYPEAMQLHDFLIRTRCK